MNFSEALELLKVGKSLRRRGWNGKGLSVHLWIADGLTYPTFRIEDDEYRTNTWIPSISDILADDWEVVGKDETIMTKVNVTLVGCDDSTDFELDVTGQEFEFLNKLSAKSKEVSSYSCMPVLRVEKQVVKFDFLR